jgi:putative peptidoglycan lipid II flippase
MSERDSLFKAAGLIAIITVISKFLGFIREASLADVFGATHSVDAYLLSQTIPFLLFDILGAALGTTFIPIYTKIKETAGPDSAFRSSSSIINATLLLCLIMVGIGELLARQLTGFVAPGFHGYVFDLTVQMSRIMFPMIPFLAVYSIVLGMLRAEGVFAISEAAGLAFNAVIIAVVLGVGARYGIKAVSAATLFAITLRLILLFPSLKRIGYRWTPNLDWNNDGLKKVVKLSGPVIIGGSVTQIGRIVDRILASGLSEGSVSALNYANRLIDLVPTIFGAAIITVMYTTLSKKAAQSDWPRFTTAFSEAVRVINFILVPVAVGIVVLRFPIVQLVYQRGVFDHAATVSTAWPLLFLSIGVVAFTLREMVSRAFFAFQDTKAPMIIGAISVSIDIILNFALIKPLRHGGLALSTSIGAVIDTLLLMWVLQKRVKEVSRGESYGIGIRAILISLAKVSLASVAMGLAVTKIYGMAMAGFTGDALPMQLWRLLIAIIGGMLVYIVCVFVLRVPEVKNVLGMIKSLISKKRDEAEA